MIWIEFLEWVHRRECISSNSKPKMCRLEKFRLSNFTHDNKNSFFPSFNSFQMCLLLLMKQNRDFNWSKMNILWSELFFSHILSIMEDYEDNSYNHFQAQAMHCVSSWILLFESLFNWWHNFCIWLLERLCIWMCI